MAGPRGDALISVVVPARNAASTIAECLAALHGQDTDCRYEVIVADNASVDATATLALDAGVRVVTAEHLGPAAARNAGIKAARGDIICFTDADCAPAPNWIEEISRPLRDGEVIGSKGVYATRQRAIVARFVQLEYEDKYDRLAGQRRINFVDTYSAAYMRDVLLANNGFDERLYFVEDQELSFRLAARGYEMIFQPTAVVYHYHVDTLRGYFVKKFNIGFWKAQVIRRFPTHGVSDSHTPQVMKVQMGLATLAAATLLGGVVAPPLWLATLALMAAFAATTVPFVRKAWGKDRAVAVAAPALLVMRALALSAGSVSGFLRPQPEMVGQKTTIGGLNYIGKRALDVVGALLGLAFTAVVGPLLAIAIKLDSPGPVLFAQERVGQGGQPFTIYKFRSMHRDAEAELPALVDVEALPEPMFKLADDPRRTAVGRFMRRWSLDELPQFWNVLKGDMSLIGPRPEETRIARNYTAWHRRRLAVKPGLTGPMQVNGRADLSLDDRVRLELEYIENYSLWHDLVILAKTIPAVLTGQGAR